MVETEKQSEEERKRIERQMAFLRDIEKKNPSNLWIWVLVLLAIIGFLWIGGTRMIQQMESKPGSSPFFQVTNREMSLFLWHNPEYIRANFRDTPGYLPDFHIERRTPELENADKYAIAPAEVFFLYHTWKRLLSQYVSTKPIPFSEFTEFLNYAEEWQPKNWPDCPLEYKQWMEEMQALKDDSLQTFQIENLQNLSEKVLPGDVRIAFIGWKNYFREGDLIDELQPTVSDVREFLGENPNYARNYWRNIYPKYLESFLDQSAKPGDRIPDDEMPLFLKAAIFNYQQSQ